MIAGTSSQQKHTLASPKADLECIRGMIGTTDVMRLSDGTYFPELHGCVWGDCTNTISEEITTQSGVVGDMFDVI